MRIRRGMLRREGSKLGRTEEGKMIMQGCLLVVVGMAIAWVVDVTVVGEGLEYESEWIYFGSVCMVVPRAGDIILILYI